MVDTVVLHSGGLDSTVCLHMAVAAGRRVLALGIDYGQLHRVELEYALKQCLALGVPQAVVAVSLGGLPHAPSRPRSVAAIQSDLSPSFLPGRNLVLLSLAGARAVAVGANEIWFGSCGSDRIPFPDCRPDFISAFSSALQAAVPAPIEVVTPLLHLTKLQIAACAVDFGLGPDDTWSCYNPIASADVRRACGSCDACVMHSFAWSAIPKGEPTVAQTEGRDR